MFVLFFITACFMNIYSGISVLEVKAKKNLQMIKRKKTQFFAFFKIVNHVNFLSFLLY